MISILIVDTEKITRDILFRLVAFSFPNAILHITARFESAMELCRIFKVNIVITTTSVPPTQSDAMLDALRSIEYNPIKIIIMTTESHKEELDRISSLPNTCLICKPIALDELVNLIAGKIEEIEMSRHENLKLIGGFIHRRRASLESWPFSYGGWAQGLEPWNAGNPNPVPYRLALPQYSLVFFLQRLYGDANRVSPVGAGSTFGHGLMLRRWPPGIGVKSSASPCPLLKTT